MILKVFYQDRLMGTLSDENALGQTLFAFDPTYREIGPDLSPFTLSTSVELHWRRERKLEGLPGLFYDSLPDKWGQRVMQARAERIGINIERLSSLEKLSWVGSQSMGALRYEPDKSEEAGETMVALNLLELSRSAREILEGNYKDVLPELLESGTSAGGARPKMLIGLHRHDPDRMIARAEKIPDDYEPWLLKIETDPDKEYGKVEYAYFLMAGEAGIQIPRVRQIVVSDKGRSVAHFAIERFDRRAGKRIHIHSLAGLLERDFNHDPTDYTELFAVAEKLTQSRECFEELFRRVVFNFFCGVRDDHAKNHAFMFENGVWRPTPAYDLTYARGRNNNMCHELSLSRKKARVSKADLMDFGKDVGLAKGKCTEVIDRVKKALLHWGEFAARASLKTERAQEIESLFEVIG
jgi:serine/threonine-protein kinase HipA